MFKKLEALANLAIVITALVLCSVLIKKYLWVSRAESAPSATAKPASSAKSQKRSIQTGTKVSIPGIDWGKSPRTVVLALSTTCHFCSESAPFYQKLQPEKPSELRIVAVLPQSIEDSKNYLNKLGVPVSEVFQASLSSISGSGTPTMMLMDNNGIIKDSWVGKLSDAEAGKILARLAESR